MLVHVVMSEKAICVQSSKPLAPFQQMDEDFNNLKMF